MAISATGEPLHRLLEDDIQIEYLAPGGDRSTAGLFVSPSGRQVGLSSEAARVVERLLELLSRGRAVQLVIYDQELTTQQAADILNISRQYLIRLLDRDEIPYTKTGTHRRLRLEDVLAYRQRRSELRREALRNITRASQEAGDY